MIGILKLFKLDVDHSSSDGTSKTVLFRQYAFNVMRSTADDSVFVKLLIYFSEIVIPFEAIRSMPPRIVRLSLNFSSALMVDRQTWHTSSLLLHLIKRATSGLAKFLIKGLLGSICFTGVINDSFNTMSLQYYGDLQFSFIIKFK